MENPCFRDQSRKNPCFKGRIKSEASTRAARPEPGAIRGSDERPARRLPRAAAEANRAVDMLRTGGDLDAVMQLGSAGGRGARGGAKRI